MIDKNAITQNMLLCHQRGAAILSSTLFTYTKTRMCTSQKFAYISE